MVMTITTRGPSSSTARRARPTGRRRCRWGASTGGTAPFQTRSEEVPGGGGRIWHVAPNGRSGARGGETTPLKSIQQAVDRGEPGDVVLVHPGVYREAVTVRQSGTTTDYLQIRAAGPGVVLDGA